MHILLVEDNSMNQKLMTRMLVKFGFTSEIANNGQEAIDIFDPTKFQLVLMDIQMPIMDGVTSAKKILLQYPKTVILALTANITEENKKNCLEAGMKEFITKPIDKNLLLTTLQNYQL